MVRLYPDYRGEYAEDTPSAEIKFYEVCAKLKGDFHVFHSVGWITRFEDGALDGEADFLICHPDRGFLIVEVKGGRIRADYRTGRWTSIDRNGQEHDIKDPFRQSMKGKFNVLSKFKEHRDWARLGLKKVSVGHAAFFPDVDNGRALQGPNAPTEIIGDRSDLLTLDDWLDQAFSYWSSDVANSQANPLGSGGVQLMQRIFARVVEARPLLSTQIILDESKRLHLTNRQIQTLALFSKQRRVAISGGAGTGKTVLAVEKAKRLADEGFKTLLTCYNVPLAEHLEEVCRGHGNLEVVGFHRLSKRIVDKAGREYGRDFIAEAKASFPNLDLWDHYFPIAAAYALDVGGERYDAIVVDEGQDFGEEFWLPIEQLLRDINSSPLYIFHDENQDVYTRVSSFPADASPITLPFNCRNTKAIHEAAYRYYNGPLIRWRTHNLVDFTFIFDTLQKNSRQENSMARSDMRDFEWDFIKKLLPNKSRGVKRVDDRRVINGILYALRTGIPWRDMPEQYGPWSTIYNRFNRWSKAGIWDMIFEAIVDSHNVDTVMVDSTSVRAHPTAAKLKKTDKRRCLGRSRGGLGTKIHASNNQDGLPLKLELTPNQANDAPPCGTLLTGLQPGQWVLADKAYDVNWIRNMIWEQGAIDVIPSKSNRKIPKEFDKVMYRQRNKIERFFGRLKASFRRIATRYEHTSANFLAMIKLACVRLWLEFYEYAA